MFRLFKPKKKVDSKTNCKSSAKSGLILIII